MLDLQRLNAQDLQGLSPSSLAEVTTQMLTRIGEQTTLIASQAQAIKFKDVKTERITFELSRLKAWRFGTKTERMDAEQRQMFGDALAEDQASLEAQPLALQGQRGQTPAPPPDDKTKRKPRRPLLCEHLPYYRQEDINARSNVHTPRSTLASWSGNGGAGLHPLFDVQCARVFGADVLHANETPVRRLDPGAGKTKRAYVWACERSAFDVRPGVACDFCLGRGGKHAVEFLGDKSGTLVRDEFAGCESVVKRRERWAAGCLAHALAYALNHARRKFDELIKDNQSQVAFQAVRRIAWITRIEREVQNLSVAERLAVRQSRSKPLWEKLHVSLQLARQRVPDSSSIAGAIGYSLNKDVLTRLPRSPTATSTSCCRISGHRRPDINRRRR